MPNQVSTAHSVVQLEGDLGAFTAELTSQRLVDGLDIVTLVLSSSAPAAPPDVRLVWRQPIVEMAAMWKPIGGNRALTPDWAPGTKSMVARGAPVICLHSFNGTNGLTFACSDALNVLELSAGVVEESGEFANIVRLFAEPHPPITRYEIAVRIDTRPVPYHEALADVAKWWANQPGYEPAQVPEIARLPMYSTWYSFHQQIDVAAVVDQCRLSKALGCEAVIVDDGWQTTDGSRGYAYCGDWRPDRIANMRSFVDAVHAAGQKFILWYSVPFVGMHSHAFKRFDGKFLRFDQRMGASTLDPRFPDVREYLIDTYERAMRDWGLDGFKLDFVDCFTADSPEIAAQNDGGRDYASVGEAADRLLSDVITRLRAIDPQVCIEFRQSYVGPLMRKYGNMFRASDCPNDAITNRIRTLDIRLLCGNTAAHADMIMWHPAEPAESAILQLLNVLFSVPQISVLLDRLPADHLAALKFWLNYWRLQREVLLDGQLEPLHPENSYPIVRATGSAKRIIAIYDETSIAPLGINAPATVDIINATRADRVILEAEADLGRRRVRTFDCQGRPVADQTMTFTFGAHVVQVPPAGLLTINT